MATRADQLDGTVKSLERICGQFPESEFVVPPSELLALLWEEREQVAPPDHPRRAVFLAALAAIGQRPGPAECVPRAIDLARQALPGAEDGGWREGCLRRQRPHLLPVFQGDGMDEWLE